ncbi:MAG: aldo/keto reductase [Eubacterium sp.]|nr:aldo/keto reductase [Eubacterium sp.]
MKKAKSVIFAIMIMLVISACAGRTANDSGVSKKGQEEISKEAEETTMTASQEKGSDGMSEQEGSKEEVVVMDELLLSVGDKRLSVEWEDNESVDALKDLAGSGMKIDMAMYGGFEQVGSIGTSLPRNDSQMTTGPGDIVLYSGNQIVIFYGSNSWAYTRLGRITGLDEKELEDTFGNGDVTIGLSVGAKTASEAARSFDFEDRSVMLNNGYKMPIMGLGTYSLDHDTCVNSVKALLQNGGRLIDTAYMYGNEDAVGEGVRQAMEEYGIPREEIFVITKIYPSQFDEPEAAIDMALEKLDIGYIDMMLLHHPGKGDVEAYKTMEKYVEKGKIRSIGLSNWYVEELTEFLPQVTITPALVQNEIHPYYQEQEVVPFIQEKGIVVQCWYPLGGRGHTSELLGDETIKSIAEAHGVSSAQVILRWDLQRGIVVIPGSGNPDHIKENLNLFGFELTEDEMKQISLLDRDEKHDWY